MEQCQPCYHVLTDLNKLLDDYQGMSMGHKSVKDAIMWDEQETRDIRARMTSTTLNLLALYNRLHSSQLIELQRTVQTMYDELRAGNLDSDSLSTFSIDDYSDDAFDQGWNKIAKDLEMRGFSLGTINENRNSIVDFIIKHAVEVNNREPAAGAVIPRGPELTTNAPTPHPSGTELSHDSRDIYSRPFISPHHGGSDLVENVVKAWNMRDWSAVQTLVQPYIQDLAAKNETGFLRKAIHLKAMSHSFGGDFQEAKRLFAENVRSAWLTNEISYDHTLISGGRWLGEACFHLGELSNSILAWSVSFQQAGVFAHPRLNLIGNSNDLSSFMTTLYAIDGDPAEIPGHDLFPLEDNSTKKGLVKQAVQFIQQHGSIVMRYANPLQSPSSGTSTQIHENMLRSDSFWDWRFMASDPFFNAQHVFYSKDWIPRPPAPRNTFQLLPDTVSTTRMDPATARKVLMQRLSLATTEGKSQVDYSTPDSSLYDTYNLEIQYAQIRQLSNLMLALPVHITIEGITIVSGVILDVAPMRFPTRLTGIRLLEELSFMTRLFPMRSTIKSNGLIPAKPGSHEAKTHKAACLALIKKSVRKALKAGRP